MQIHMEELCIIFNKPYGVVSQFTALAGHTPLSEFGFPKGIYPAGRLDHDSEGLLLLTSDGQLAHRLCDPSFEHPRVYWAQVERVPDAAALERLSKGITISDGPCRPSVSRIIDEPQLPSRQPPIRFRKTVPTAWVEITLTEGRNRQIRRMFEQIGHHVEKIKRVRYGSLRLDVEPGEWRFLKPREVDALRNPKPLSAVGTRSGERGGTRTTHSRRRRRADDRRQPNRHQPSDGNGSDRRHSCVAGVAAGPGR